MGDPSDESAVDLQAIKRQFREIGQTGVTRTKIIERDADSFVAKTGQATPHDVKVAKQRAFSDLDRDPLRIETGPLDLFDQPLRIARPQQVGRQQVDR
jgi:hypothetical protein